MAYYFMVEKKKGEYFPLDITKSKHFIKLTNLSKKGACSLQEIDYLTINFANEIELGIFYTPYIYLKENHLNQIT